MEPGRRSRREGTWGPQPRARGGKARCGRWRGRRRGREAGGRGDPGPGGRRRVRCPGGTRGRSVRGGPSPGRMLGGVPGRARVGLGGRPFRALSRGAGGPARVARHGSSGHVAGGSGRRRACGVRAATRAPGRPARARAGRSEGGRTRPPPESHRSSRTSARSLLSSGVEDLTLIPTVPPLSRRSAAPPRLRSVARVFLRGVIPVRPHVLGPPGDSMRIDAYIKRARRLSFNVDVYFDTLSTRSSWLRDGSAGVARAERAYICRQGSRLPW